jgi:hypothetical protein
MTGGGDGGFGGGGRWWRRSLRTMPIKTHGELGYGK